MIIALNILIFSLVFYLQSTLLARLELFGLVPSLAIVLIVAFSLHRKTHEAYIFAFLFGLALDTLSGGPYGIYTAVFMIAAFLASLVVDGDRGITRLSNAAITGIVAGIFYFLFWLIVSFQAKNFTFTGIFFVFGQVFVTVGLSVVVFSLFERLFSWENAIDARSK